MPHRHLKRHMEDGTPYRIVACVEPGVPYSPTALAEAINQAVSEMSEQSRWQRFATPLSKLQPWQLKHLTDLDGVDKVAWAALTEDHHGIGLARYVRLPKEPHIAEFAVTVIDAFQRQGIGTELMKCLLGSAKENHITCLRGFSLPSNKSVLALCKSFDFKTFSDDDFTVIDIQTDK